MQVELSSQHWCHWCVCVGMFLATKDWSVAFHLMFLGIKVVILLQPHQLRLHLKLKCHNLHHHLQKRTGPATEGPPMKNPYE